MVLAHTLSKIGRLVDKGRWLRFVVGETRLKRGVISLFHDLLRLGTPEITKTLALKKTILLVAKHDNFYGIVRVSHVPN